jgi:hypothetical protein
MLVWGLFPRFVGLLYVVAFGAFAVQMEMALSSRGTVPIAARLARIRRDYPGLRRFVEYPTLLWLNSSDAFLHALPWAGVLCGACALYGGPLGYTALLLGWVLWLSCEPAGAIFPWDTLLQEVGFLVLFLPVTNPLPIAKTSALPLPSVTFACRWLVLRLMLGFGKVKFIHATSSDALYLRSFFVWMPLPSPLGWLFHHAPRWVLRAGLYLTFTVEVVAPVLGFFAGPARLVSFGLLVSLMISIQATGNWGYFNLAYVLLCVCLLDTRASIFDLGADPWVSRLLEWPDVAIHAIMAVLFFSSLFYVMGDSWISRTWVQWSWNNGTTCRPWLRALVAFHRALAPFRLTNGYGVFPPNTAPPMRLVPVFEGSDDSITWKSYSYRYLPAFAESRPPVIAPHHPRIDYMLYYAAAGIHDASVLTSLVGDGNPYAAYTRSSWLDRMQQRLLEGDPLVLRTLNHNPFPTTPPNFVRVSAVAMTPTSPSERRRTGRWWYTRRLGTFVPARGRQAWPDALMIPDPEVFHPDFVDVKRRAPALKCIVAAHAAGTPAHRAILEGSDLTTAEVEQFWRELVPMIAEERGVWSRLDEHAAAVLARFGVERLYRLERLLERFAWLLRQSTERHFFAAHSPIGAIKSNFRYHMLLHESIVDGWAAYESALRNPASVAARIERSTDATQLWTLALVRYDAVLSVMRAFRWSDIGRRGYALGLPGVFEYYPLLVAHAPPDEEFCPMPVLHADGEYTIESFYPPPPVHANS